MLLHLGPRSKKKVLQLFNDGWRTGTVQQVWREAIIIPILKRGKCKSKAESYRPISLTSCVGKLMERLINTRLMWHLENKSSSHQNKQLLGKIGLLRTKSPISPKLSKMPSKTKSTHLQYGLTWKRLLTRCGKRVSNRNCTSVVLLGECSSGLDSTCTTGKQKSR